MDTIERKQLFHWFEVYQHFYPLHFFVKKKNYANIIYSERINTSLPTRESWNVTFLNESKTSAQHIIFLKN